MHRKLKWLSLSMVFAAAAVWAAPGDGTFTFRIEGPDGSSTAAQTTAPAAQTASPRVIAPASRERTPVTSATTYTVQSSDTLWAISQRFMPQGANAFQTAAAIYRRNPEAFINGNVNNLRRTILNIPDAQSILSESTQQGADLLREGRMSLASAAQAVQMHGAALLSPGEASAHAPSQNAQSLHPVQMAQPSALAQTSEPTTNPADVEKTMPPREYVARETMLRSGERNLSGNDHPPQDGQLLPASMDGFYSDSDGSAADSDGATVSEVNDPTQGERRAPEVAHLNELDFNVIRELIDSTNQAIAESGRVVDEKLSQAVARSETVAANAATAAAREEVTEIMARYESLISDLQQSNAELRANISKLGKQIDQVRQTSIQNADALAAMQENFVDVDEKTSNAIIPQGPLMWILLGLGLMCLILASTLFYFKHKSRQSAAMQQDAEDFMDDEVSTELLSSAVVLSQEDQEKLKEQQDKPEEEKEEPKEEQTDEKPKDESSEETTKPNEPSRESSRLDADEIQIPKSMFEENESLARKAKEMAESQAREQAEAERAASEDAMMRQWQEQNQPSKEVAERIKKSEDEIMKAWEEAAQEKADDKETLDAWAQALKEQESSGKKAQVEVKDDNLLSKEQLASQSAEVLSPEEQMAKEWEAALKEQSSASQSKIPKPEDKPLSAEDKMAQEWESALKEQGSASQTESLKPDDKLLSAEEKMAKEWEAALNEQKGATHHESLKSDDKPLSADEKMAQEWEAALREQVKSEASHAGEVSPKNEAPADKIGADGAAALTDHQGELGEQGANLQAALASGATAAAEKASAALPLSGNPDPNSILNSDKSFAEALAALVESNRNYYRDVKHQDFDLNENFYSDELAAEEAQPDETKALADSIAADGGLQLGESSENAQGSTLSTEEEAALAAIMPQVMAAEAKPKTAVFEESAVQDDIDALFSEDSEETAENKVTEAENKSQEPVVKAQEELPAADVSLPESAAQDDIDALFDRLPEDSAPASAAESLPQESASQAQKEALDAQRLAQEDLEKVEQRFEHVPQEEALDLVSEDQSVEPAGTEQTASEVFGASPSVSSTAALALDPISEAARRAQESLKENTASELGTEGIMTWEVPEEYQSPFVGLSPDPAAFLPEENAEPAARQEPLDKTLDDEALASDSEAPDEESKALSERNLSVLMEPDAALAQDEDALLNMLGSKLADHAINENDIVTAPLSDDDLAAMLSSEAPAEATASESIAEPLEQDDRIATFSQEEPAGSEDTAVQYSNAAEDVVSDPAVPEGFAVSDQTLEEAATAESKGQRSSEITPDLRDKLTSDLNLALMLFETGENEEALELIREVTDHGTPDLVVKAQEMVGRYGH